MNNTAIALNAPTNTSPSSQPETDSGSPGETNKTTGPTGKDLLARPTSNNTITTLGATSPLLGAFNAPRGRVVSTSEKRPASISKLGPATFIANFVKSTLNSKTDAEMKSMVKSYLTTMQLMNSDGEWAHPKLAEIGDKLFPPNLSKKDFKALVDEMAENASENPNIHSFLEKAKEEGFPELAAKIKKEGGKLIPGFAAYAMTLQNITAAMRDDHEVAKACGEVWKAKHDEVGGALKNIGWKGAIKYHSVAGPFKRMNEALEKGEVDPDFCRFMLPLNIIEAMAVDMGAGNGDNAKAAWILANHRPGNEPNEATGEGDATITEDGNGIALNMPLPKDWADGYHAWNMAFVSQFAQFPYAFSKLLIPEVADYQDEPSEYIHTRALALYAHLNFVLHRQTDGVGAKGEFNWATPELTKLFGEVNREKAEEYAAEVERLNPSLSRRVKDFIVNFLMSIFQFLQSIPAILFREDKEEWHPEALNA